MSFSFTLSGWVICEHCTNREFLDSLLVARLPGIGVHLSSVPMPDITLGPMLYIAALKGSLLMIRTAASLVLYSTDSILHY